MSVTYNTALTNRQADSAATAFDAGSLKIYTGTQPASANDAATGTLLCTITLPANAFTAPVAGVCDLQGSWAGTGAAAGTAGWGRFTSADTTLVMDGTIDTDFSLDDNSITISGAVTVTICTLSQVSGE